MNHESQAHLRRDRVTTLDDDHAVSYFGGRERRVRLHIHRTSRPGLVARLRALGALPVPQHRQVLEGVIVRGRITQYSDGLVDGFEFFLGVDDGRSEEVLVRSLGTEREGSRQKLSANPFHYLRNGDHVRMHVAARSGQILSIEPLADAAGEALPPIGTMPAEPLGSPLTTQDVARLLHMAVRRTTASERGDVQSFAFQLVNDPPGRVVVLVASGAEAVTAIEAAAGAGDPVDHASRRRRRVDYPARTYPVVRNYSGELIVASQTGQRYGAGHAAGVVWPSHLRPYAAQPSAIHEALVNLAMDRLARTRKR